MITRWLLKNWAVILMLGCALGMLLLLVGCEKSSTHHKQPLAAVVKR